MKKGFTSVVPGIVKANPGRTAEEIAQHALQSGLCGSDAMDPVRSLANTLEKYRDEITGIVHKYEGGTRRYYPSQGSTAQGPAYPTSEAEAANRRKALEVHLAKLAAEAKSKAESQGSPAQSPAYRPKPPLAVSLALSTAQAEVVESLVESGRFPSRSDAVRWLIDQGIAAKAESLGKLVEAAKGLRKAREALRFMAPDITPAQPKESESLLAMDAKADPVLAELWSNELDASYDTI